MSKTVYWWSLHKQKIAVICDNLKVSSVDGLLLKHDWKKQVATLSEKLQGKEVAPGIVDVKQDVHAAEIIEEKVPVKAEDRLSIGSGGSAVVDGERNQLVDSSGESYFHDEYQGGCCIVGEEDDGSDDGCSYAVFANQHHPEPDPDQLGWCFFWNWRLLSWGLVVDYVLCIADVVYELWE